MYNVCLYVYIYVDSFMYTYMENHIFIPSNKALTPKALTPQKRFFAKRLIPVIRLEVNIS